MTATLLTWTPRILGLLIAAFFAMFSVGAAGKSHSIVDGLMHFAPALLVLGAVVAAWHGPLVGAVAFGAYAAVYAITTRTRLDWIVVIAGPLLVAGILYALQWRLTKPR